ncbi:MAG: 2-oxoacid:ferredoxin oxidoreductase subunit beta, partial [Chloroflexi bacterium]|nr:2-oxoacid:ferredoxin oxidoreductase subunit beta [Chloroflexota bacterium]
MVSGIGCSGRMPVYADFCTMHVTHGRALSFATGLKMAQPQMKVLAVMGDGDAVAIGGNHFIHAARRNIGLHAIIINNLIYGMTGGQYSPTTPTDAHATTAPYGNIEQPFDIARLAEAAGAPFVARGTVYHVHELEKLMEKTLLKTGFALLEIISNCHVAYGRQNEMGSAVSMLRWMRDSSVPVAKANGSIGKTTRGVLVDKELPEYTELYAQIIERARSPRPVGSA